MKGRELRRLYRERGWEKIRQNGSHEQWGKGEKRETISTADGDDIPKGLLQKLLKRLNED